MVSIIFTRRLSSTFRLSFILTYCSKFYKLLEYLFLILNKPYLVSLNDSNIINSAAEDFSLQYICKKFEHPYAYISKRIFSAFYDFCMQKTLKTSQAFSVFVYVLRSSIKCLLHSLTAAADSKSLSCSTAYLSERR